jgi:hypothetical protein
MIAKNTRTGKSQNVTLLHVYQKDYAQKTSLIKTYGRK